MTQATNIIKKNFKKLNPLTVSWILVVTVVFIYPHKAIGGGALIDGKTIIMTLMACAFALYMTLNMSLNKPVFLPSPVTWPLIFFSLLIIVSTLYAQNQPIALEASLLFLAYIFCFYMFLSLFHLPGRQIQVVYAFILLALYLSLFGLVLYYLMNLNPRLSSIWRLRATFGNSNQMGGFLAMMIPLGIGLMLEMRDKKKWLLVILSLINFIMVAALFFTFARGGWISTFIASGFVLSTFILKRNVSKIKFFSSVLITLLLFFALFLSSTELVKRFTTMTQQDAQTNIYGRLLAWEGTMNMIKANPVTGVGPGNYAKAFRQYQPPGLMDPYMFAHNDYLHFISETGVLLIPIMLWLLYSLFSHGFKKIRDIRCPYRYITTGAMGGIIAILIYSITDFNLHIPANAMLFVVLAALVAAPVPKLQYQADVRSDGRKTGELI